MESVHGHTTDGWAAATGGATSPPPPPPRPTIPPKPGGAGTKTTTGTQADSSRIHSAVDASSPPPSTSNMHPGRPVPPVPFSPEEGPSPPHTFRSPSTNAAILTTGPKSPPNPVLHHSQISPSGSGNRPFKPALPPKPVVSPSVILNSPPLAKFPPSQRTPPKLPIHPSVLARSGDSANLLKNSNVASSQPPPQSPTVANGEQNGNLVHSPPTFLRAKPPQPPISPGNPLLSPRITSPSNSRPNSSACFNFSSPIQNLNSSNFPSTSGGLNQVGGGPGVTSPQRLAEIRTKSASLGRNITFPFTTSSTTSTSSSGGGFFARKSATLSKFLPLDLQLGNFTKSPPTTTTPAVVTSPSRPKPNSLNLNPFIIQQKQQQQKLNHPQMSQVNQAPLNFGRSIAFSPDSPLPPPPPPRLKKKLSPVNSIGSPNSPTSPSFPVSTSLTANSISLPPNSPLPPPPPISPSVKPIEAIPESAEDLAAIYAEVNKEKKWADRKLKQEEITRKLSLDSSMSISPTTPEVSYSSPIFSNNASNVNKSESSQNESNAKNVSGTECDTNSLKTTEDDCRNSPSSNDEQPITVKSWLRTHINGVTASETCTDEKPNANSTLSPKNPFRSVSPTYQSVNTGHIYETIGENQKTNNNDNDGFNNNLNNNNNHKNKLSNNKSIHTSVNAKVLEIQETSEVIPSTKVGDSGDELCENQSFLFKLVINPKIVNGDEQTAAKDETTLKNESISNNNRGTIADTNGEHTGTDTVAVVQSSKTVTSGEQQNKAAVADVVFETALSSSSLPSSQSIHENGQKIKEVGKNDASSNSNDSSYLIPTVVQDLSDITSPESISKGEPDLLTASNSSFQSTATEGSVTATGTTPSSSASRANSILRRRSWNCDRIGSPSPSESSSTTSSISNLPYQHRRDRSYTSDKGSSSNRDSLLLREDWVDEGNLSNGALADAESSDVQLRSSAEDIIVNVKGGGRGDNTANSSASSSFSNFKARRLVNSFFGSFGKGNNSYSSSSSGGGRKSTGMRHSGGSAGNKRNKDKTISHFIPSQHHDGVLKLGRQISDSVISTSMISGPILPSSASFDSGISPHKPQSVQFSPEIPETRLIYHHEQYSSEEAAIGKSRENVGAGTSPSFCALSIEETTGVVMLDRGDDESVSSSESVSGCGSVSGTSSVSGYEDILADLSPKEKKSFYVAREILTSERTFVDVLNLLTIDFPKSLDNARRYHGGAVISKQDMETILGGLPNLKQVNENLLSDLEERIAHWKDSKKIADILVKKGPFLKLYATYIKDFQKNSMHFDTCCQRYPLFADVVRDFELSERCQKLGLKHYMLKPVQRMPQYRLLLEDYLKSLDKEESSDYDDTVKGIAIVKDVAEHANEAIRLQVNAEKLLHLQNRLSTGTIILKADRQLIKEGELLKASRKELQPRFFALMNDCLLCLTYHAAAGSPKDLKLRYELPLAGMRVSISPTEDFKNEFSVISITRSFSLVAKSTRERDDWMKALNNAIHDNIKKRTCSTPDEEIGFQLGKEAPVWIQDSRVTMCQLCTAEFTVTFRRHHCRACGKVVCGNCSSGQAPLQYLNNSSSRVCDSCYEHLLDEFDNKPEEEMEPRDSRARSSIRDRFKKVTPNVSKRATKIKRIVPSRLEVHANSSGSRISGYLTWREKEKKSWKRRWFVLMERVLYIYAASEDIVAIKSIPLLGWEVAMDRLDPQQENEDNQSLFRLTHLGQHPILFQADSPTTAEKWVAAMSEAVVLS